MTLDPQSDDILGLKDLGVLITGAASVISVWTARLFLQAGARVVMTDRLDRDGIGAAFAAHAAERQDPDLVLDAVTLLGSVDIRNRHDHQVAERGKPDQTSVASMVRAAVAELGQIDILINVAGGQEPVPAAALASEILQRTIDRILVGTWNVIHEVFEQSMREHGGRIVTVTADCFQGYPLMPAMGAARNGLSSLHRAIAVEWAPLGVSGCVVAPGATDTPGLRRYPKELRVTETGVESANLGRLLHPREVAYLLVTLASPWAVAVNGHTVGANGGDSFVTPLYSAVTKSGIDANE